MMEDVVILNQYLVNPVESLWFVSLLILGFAIAGFLIGNYYKYINDAAHVIATIIGILLFLAAVVIFAIWCAPQDVGIRTDIVYEVTYTEDTKMKDFYEKYEVLEYRGSIFKVKEKPQVTQEAE